MPRPGTGIGGIGQPPKPEKITTISGQRTGDDFSFRMPEIDAHQTDCAPQEINDTNAVPVGRALGSSVLYPVDQLKNYPSQYARYGRGVGLTPIAILDNDEGVFFRYCSNQSPSGFWTVTVTPTELCRAWRRCEEWEGKAILFPKKTGQNLFFRVSVAEQVVNDFPAGMSDPEIRIYTWSQHPNYSMIGRAFYGQLPRSGGTFSIAIEAGVEGVSFFARDPRRQFFFRALCFSLTGSEVLASGWSW